MVADHTLGSINKDAFPNKDVHILDGTLGPAGTHAGAQTLGWWRCHTLALTSQPFVCYMSPL